MAASNVRLVYVQDNALENISHPARGFSFGFEVEFQNDATAFKKIFEKKSGQIPRVRVEKFPCLDGTFIQEETGNWEVRSKPYLGENAVLGQVIRDMKEIKTVLCGMLRSFHIHIRFPTAYIPHNKKKDFRGWISRLQDALFFWRLQYRNEWYALSAWCMTRQPITTQHMKGPLRLQVDKPEEGKYDLELRGFMSCGRKIQQFVQVLVNAVIRQHYVGFYSFQYSSTLTSKQEGIVKFFERHRTSSCRVLGEREITFLHKMYNHATRLKRGNTVLFDLENAPYLNEDVKANIRKENREFVRKFDTFFRDALDRNRHSSNGEQYSEYRRRLKNWAIACNLHEHITKSLTILEDVRDGEMHETNGNVVFSERPPDHRNQNPEVHALPIEYITHGLIDLNIVQVAGKNPITYGFEAEFASDIDAVTRENFLRGMNFPGMYRANTEKYSFLEKNAGKEVMTGNFEVRSVPYVHLPTCISDMLKVKRDLGNHLKGFHLHMRFDRSGIPDEQLFRSWVSRIGDCIFFWRLQHRKVSYALLAWSVKRSLVGSLEKRGTVRLQVMQDQYDFEIRGFMNSTRSIYRMADIVTFGVTHPDQMNHGYPFQSVSCARNRQTSLPEFFKRYSSGGCKEIKEREEQFLDKLQKNATYNGEGNAILFRLESDPYFPDDYKQMIETHNRNFVREFQPVLEIFFQGDQGNREFEEAAKQYRSMLKKWACRLDLHTTMTACLLREDI